MKSKINTNANIITKKIRKKFKHNGKYILSIDIEYPSIRLSSDYVIKKSINSEYRIISKKFYIYATKVMLPRAIQQYIEFNKEQYPFNTYEAVMKYKITLNNNCILSTYIDQYTYEGGAHGNTQRISNTWNLQNGDEITLKDIFKNTNNYKEKILEQIKKKANKNIEKNPGIYFENYEELIDKNFNEKSFYLTEDSINVYFQHYEIAPYSTGIVVFSIPYKDLSIHFPNCKNL